MISSSVIPTSIDTLQTSSQSLASSKSTITVTPTDTLSNTQTSAAATTAPVSNDPDEATATYTGTAVPSGTTIPDSELQLCTEEKAKSGPFPPFCEPQNATTKYTGKTYFVTWWTGYFSSGTLVSAKLDFQTNVSQNAWHSDNIDKNMGFAYLPVDDPMLQGGDRNNLTLTLVANNPDDDEPAKIIPGPVITVSKPEATHLPPPPPTSINKLGLEIGIPVAILVIALVLGVVFISTRKHRAIGIGNIMGRRRKGYGVGKSRRQRVGKNGNVGVSETEFDSSMNNVRDEPRDEIEMHDQYRDADAGAGRGREDNAFRDEILRQQTGR